MASKITDLKEEDGTLTFTISNTDVSYVNGIRRTILSDIPIVVFKTTPYEQNKATITFNTTRLNNEIIKQRLSCIPICISDFKDMSFKNYLLELDVENKTDTKMIVTTKDFKIKNLATDTFLEEADVRKIFPPFVSPNGHEYFIDFLRLRPKLSDEIPGEKIKLTCEFSISTARDDSMFNVTGTCAHGCTPDPTKIQEELAIRKQKWKDEGKNESEIKFEASNWVLLEGLRYVKKYSFDFIIQSVGIYDNDQIIIKSCDVLVERFAELKNMLSRDEVEIKASDNTMENSYDVILENEDYTIGNILNYELYQIFYSELKVLNYVGFKKMHPHDTSSILRMDLTDTTKGVSTVKTMLQAVIDQSIKKINSIKGCFDGTRDKCD
jgi:DNA-directed RNA polymerase subunit L